MWVVASRVESGLDDLDSLGHLGHFFGGLSRLSSINWIICIVVTQVLIDRMFLRKMLWHVVVEWTLGLVNPMNDHWYETSLLRQAVVKHEISYTESLPRMKKFYGSVFIIFHDICITFRKKMSACRSYVCGSHLDCFVGQVGQQMWPIFNPGS